MNGRYGLPRGRKAKTRFSRRGFILLALLSTGVLAGCSDDEVDVRPAQAKELLTALPPPRPSSTPTPTQAPAPTPTPTVEMPSDILFANLGTHMPSESALPSPPRLPPERILIPRVGIDAKIVPVDTKFDKDGNWVWETAAFAVGHHRGTANPGQRGNIVLSGHISSPNEGAVFKRLPEVAVGDGVILRTAEQDYLYRVVSTVVVEPTNLEAVKPTPDETLTLITCVPDGVYTHRLVVTAKRVQPSRSVRP